MFKSTLEILGHMGTRGKGTQMLGQVLRLGHSSFLGCSSAGRMSKEAARDKEGQEHLGTSGQG